MSDSDIQLSSNRPYLLRAIYDWLLDNHLTPQILVDASQGDVKVPQQHVKDGKILLNIGVDAINNLVMDNYQVSFSARFSGKSMTINAPIPAVMAIFARENGQGMAFPDEPEMEQALVEEITEKPTEEPIKEPSVATVKENDLSNQKSDSLDKPKRSTPTLKIVK